MKNLCLRASLVAIASARDCDGFISRWAHSQLALKSNSTPLISDYRRRPAAMKPGKRKGTGVLGAPYRYERSPNVFKLQCNPDHLQAQPLKWESPWQTPKVCKAPLLNSSLKPRPLAACFKAVWQVPSFRPMGTRQGLTAVNAAKFVRTSNKLLNRTRAHQKTLIGQKRAFYPERSAMCRFCWTSS